MVNLLQENALFEEGKGLYEIGDMEGALEIFGRVVNDSPNDFLAQGYLGLALLALGRYEQAIFRFNIAKTRAATTSDPRDLEEVLFNLALSYKKLGEQQLAEARLLGKAEPGREGLLLAAAINLQKSTDAFCQINELRKKKDG